MRTITSPDFNARPAHLRQIYEDVMLGGRRDGARVVHPAKEFAERILELASSAALLGASLLPRFPAHQAHRYSLWMRSSNDDFHAMVLPWNTVAGTGEGSTRQQGAGLQLLCELASRDGESAPQMAVMCLPAKNASNFISMFRMW